MTLRHAVLATAMVSTGLLSAAGAALAAPSPDHGAGPAPGQHGHAGTVQEGLLNSEGFAPTTTGQCSPHPTGVLCDIPGTLLG